MFGRVFGFGFFHGLQVFSNLVFGFRFSSFFGYSCPAVHFTIMFLVLPRKLHPAVALKPA